MITYPRSVVSCLVSDDFEIFHDFKLSKPKRETRLSIMSSPPFHLNPYK